MRSLGQKSGIDKSKVKMVEESEIEKSRVKYCKWVEKFKDE